MRRPQKPAIPARRVSGNLQICSSSAVSREIMQRAVSLVLCHHQEEECTFSFPMSCRGALTCCDAGCLTSCHLTFVSDSCHFFRGGRHAFRPLFGGLASADTRRADPHALFRHGDGDVPTALSGLDAAAEYAASRYEQNESSVLSAVSASGLFLCQPGNQSAR
jgi:hypothetical protein